MCHSQCMSTINAPDRWSHGACSVCYMDDFDGDGFITQEDLGREFDAYCGNEDGNDVVTYLLVNNIYCQIHAPTVCKVKFVIV